MQRGTHRRWQIRLDIVPLLGIFMIAQYDFGLFHKLFSFSFKK
jgi:hypothetical protein